MSYEPRSERKNSEGLTFREWLNASGLPYTWAARQAWERGEDPTEHKTK